MTLRSSRQTQLAIGKLERALEDVLEKLNMPALDLYVQPAIISPHKPTRSTRHNTEEIVNNECEVSPGPMNSLIEATQLNGLRSQLRSVKQRKKGGMGRKDSDMVSENLITFEEAEEMLELCAATPCHIFARSLVTGLKKHCRVTCFLPQFRQMRLSRQSGLRPRCYSLQSF